MKRGLIVFAKEPLPGRVKSRLAATIGDIAAAELYQAMLRDVLNLSRKLTGVETVVYWDCPEQTLPLLAERFGCRSRRQPAGDLGVRMQAAFAEMFDDHEICCIIGSDTPDLPLAYVQEAFDLLAAETSDTVFGPSADGGYYLLGLRRVIPQLFTAIDWSTDLVLRQSMAAAASAGCRATLLPEWHDIDTHADLEAFGKRAGGVSAPRNGSPSLGGLMTLKQLLHV